MDLLQNILNTSNVVYLKIGVLAHSGKLYGSHINIVIRYSALTNISNHTSAGTLDKVNLSCIMS